MYALASTETYTLTHFKCEMVTIDIHIYLHTYTIYMHIPSVGVFAIFLRNLSLDSRSLAEI